MESLTIETCECTWIFQTDPNRFRRAFKPERAGTVIAASQWHPYLWVEVDRDRDTFTIYLTSGGTRMIRSSRHVGDCEKCRQDRLFGSVDHPVSHGF